jgi:hypothetical protein
MDTIILIAMKQKALRSRILELTIRQMWARSVIIRWQIARNPAGRKRISVSHGFFENWFVYHS